ncbi:hypothetical protein ScPMuIL_010682 [Solemya velum]
MVTNDADCPVGFFGDDCLSHCKTCNGKRCHRKTGACEGDALTATEENSVLSPVRRERLGQVVPMCARRNACAITSTVHVLKGNVCTAGLVMTVKSLIRYVLLAGRSLIDLAIWESPTLKVGKMLCRTVKESVQN